MALIPTEEQQAILYAVKTDEDIVVDALAGTGKTSTLKMIGEARPDKRGLYIAYNRAIADDAKASFPSNVTCTTAHSLAYKVIVKHPKSKYGWRLQNSMRVPGRDLAAQLHTSSFKLDEKDVVLSEVHVAYMVMDTVRRFCSSASREITNAHVPYQDGASEDDMEELRDICVKKAKEVWADVNTENGTKKFEHDHYLKMWQLGNPMLSGIDFMMLDEAQDANPVMADIFERQIGIQRIMVGDPNQAIYGWRGALDAMKGFKGIRLSLTQSFRFGDAIAEEANKWLKLLKSENLIKGFDKIDSRIESLDLPDAILCRTNSGGVSNIFELQKNGHSVALVGGGQDVKNFAFAALDLMKDKPTTHPQLAAFQNWQEVVEYVEEDAAGGDLKVSVKLIQQFGASQVINAMNQLVSETEADTIISTAHKAKGREWNNVRISSDFMPRDINALDGVPVPSTTDMMLNYVTVTRAKEVLDRGGLSWVDLVVETDDWQRAIGMKNG